MLGRTWAYCCIRGILRRVFNAGSGLACESIGWAKVRPCAARAWEGSSPSILWPLVERVAADKGRKAYRGRPKTHASTTQAGTRKARSVIVKGPQSFRGRRYVARKVCMFLLCLSQFFPTSHKNIERLCDCGARNRHSTATAAPPGHFGRTVRRPQAQLMHLP